MPENVIGRPGHGRRRPVQLSAVGSRHDVQGERLATRQEIDWPFQLGAVKVVPYALGEAAHWGEDINGNSLDRLFWQAGVRASMPMWSVDPTVYSDLLNVHGIAHKVVFDAEFSYAEANRNLDDLPLYDPLDDDSVEAFRRRFLTTTFGIPSMSRCRSPPGTPWIAAVRRAALRPADRPAKLGHLAQHRNRRRPDGRPPGGRTAMADQARPARQPPHHRLDHAGHQHHVVPQRQPRQFRHDGGPVGLRLPLARRRPADVGQRRHVRLLQPGPEDRLASAGSSTGRRAAACTWASASWKGPDLNSQVLSLSYSYWMSPKWVSSFGTSIDLGNQGNIGQNFSITRVGESFLISAGFTVDAARNNVGADLIIEPRFLPKSRLGNVGRRADSAGRSVWIGMMNDE